MQAANMLEPQKKQLSLLRSNGVMVDMREQLTRGPRALVQIKTQKR